MKKGIIRYLITIVVGLLMAWAFVASRNLFEQTELDVIFQILCDGFFVPGVFITAAGLIVFTSNHGAFDLLSYGLKSFVDMFKRRDINIRETFYDYKAKKEGKKTGFGFLLICGLFFLALSLIMWLLYRNNI